MKRCPDGEQEFATAVRKKSKFRLTKLAAAVTGRGNAHHCLAWLCLLTTAARTGNLDVFWEHMRQNRRGQGFLRGGAPLFLLLVGGSFGLAAIIQQKIDVKVRAAPGL